MDTKEVLKQLDKTLSEETKDNILNHFNAMYDTDIKSLEEDERVFVALYTNLVKALAMVGSSLAESASANDDELEDIKKEDMKAFRMSTSYASHMIKTAMEIAETTTVMQAINEA